MDSLVTFSCTYVGERDDSTISRVWVALEFTEISIGITISPFAFMAIQLTPHRFIFKPHFPDKILRLTQ